MPNETEVQIATLEDLGVESESSMSQWAGARPIVANAVGGRPGRVPARVMSPRGITVNSMLREDEWVELDAAVVESARAPLRAVNDLRTAGLTRRLGGLGTLVAQWYAQSDMSAAEVSMTGQSTSNDLPDLKRAGVPVPVVFKTFVIDTRSLEASRRMGDGLDVSAAAAASRVVAEKLEDLLINGAAIQVNGQKLHGYTSHPNRATDTAANYGGGDWGTLANPLKTVAGMIAAAYDNYNYGPFMVYASTTQYQEAIFSWYEDGTADTPADRIKRLPDVRGFNFLPGLADGVIALVTLNRNAVEWAEAMDIQVREWMSGDGMTANFKVLAVAAPIIKADYNSKTGIVVATGA